MNRTSWICPLAGLALLAAGAAVADPVAWSGGITAVAQTASDDRIHDSATASADLVGELGTRWGQWTLFAEGATEVQTRSVSGQVPESNGDAGSVQDRYGRGHAQISEFKLAIPVAVHQSLTLGLIDPSSYVDQSKIASDENSQFLAANFVQNPTIAFPDYALGLVYEQFAEPGSPGFRAVVSSSHGLADTPGRAYHEILDFAEQGRGVFAALARGWVSGVTSTRAGVWINTADFQRLDGDGEQDNYGAYLLHGVETSVGRFSARIGAANPRVSMARGYLALAWQKAWRNRVLGIGVAGISASPDAPAPAADGLNAEIYLRWAPLAGLFVTPSLQYFRNPGLDGSGIPVDANLGVANLRLTWLW